MQPHKQGFSLIEILLAVSLLLILGLSSYSLGRHMQEKQELRQIKDQIQEVIRYAKLQALLEDRRLYITPLDAQNWSSGLRLLGEQRQVIQVWQWQHPHWQISWQGFSKKAEIAIAALPQQAQGNGRFVLQNKSSGKQSTLILNRMGRVSQE